MKTARRRNPTCPVSVEHGDVSQVWAPLPGARQATPEEMSADARRRARYYSGSKFWGRATDALCFTQPEKKQLRLLDC